MPVVMYKETTIQAMCFQVRRVMCEYCSEHFLYHHSQSVTGQSTGIPLLSSDTSMANNRFSEFVGYVVQRLDGKTPGEVFDEREPANKQPRMEPRAKYPGQSPCASPQAPVRGSTGVKICLVVSYLEGRKHLLIFELGRVYLYGQPPSPP